MCTVASGRCLSMGDYVKVRPIRRRYPALGSAQRPFVLATLNAERRWIPAFAGMTKYGG
jgi:hypothetical protein